jgi:hypothetical protein
MGWRLPVSILRNHFRVYTQAMLRNAIAVLLVATLAILAMPCAYSAISQPTSHDCCAPSLQANGMDCCGTASPHPATAPSPDRGTQACFEDAVPSLLPFALAPAIERPMLALGQPSKRIPATILRT